LFMLVQNASTGVSYLRFLLQNFGIVSYIDVLKKKIFCIPTHMTRFF